MRDDDATLDALVRYHDHLERRGVRVEEPERGDEPGWCALPVPEWGWHIHRRPAYGGGYVWLAYGHTRTSKGGRVRERAPLVATAKTRAGGELPLAWTRQPGPGE